uniref:Uncharacterized protein n=1 Tax=Rhizophora mucronata TaxID=61149 RepID=A0A2P2NK45_RHIMU
MVVTMANLELLEPSSRMWQIMCYQTVSMWRIQPLTNTRQKLLLLLVQRI